MEDDYKKLDKLERFFDEEINQNELEEDLKNKDFQEEATFFQAMVNVLHEEEQLELDKAIEKVDIQQVNPTIRAQLDEQNKRLSGAKTRRLFPLRRVLAIAASVAVLLVAIGIWWTQQSPDTSALAAEYYQEADLPGTMSGGAVVDKNFQAGLTAFAVEEDFETARRIFAAIPLENPRYAEAQYFLGHIAFQQEEFATAELAYENALAAENLPNYIDSNRVTWNLMLSRLGMGEDIEEELKNFLPTATAFDELARELVEELDSD